MKRQAKRKSRVAETMAHMQLMKLLLHVNRLDVDDRKVLAALVDDVLNDRDPRERFWRTSRGAPPADFEKKQIAVVKLAYILDKNGAKPAPGNPTDAQFDAIAAACGLTFEVVKHAWRSKHVYGVGTIRGTSKLKKKQSDK